MKNTVAKVCITLACLFVVVGAAAFAEESHRTDWFRDAGWGVFTHYLTGAQVTAEDWNRQVEAFDVPGLAKQLDAIGARYYVITLGQNSGHYCAPNAAYDRYAGIQPSKCSKRDLIADLYDALAPKGITLMLYLPSQTPASDPAAKKGFGLPSTGWDEDIDEVFAKKWAEVIQEWSVRYGKKVAGWWFDGSYRHVHFNEAIAQIYAAAARAGNPDSIVAFNPGVTLRKWTDAEDYTAGEINDADTVSCEGRWEKGKQWHMLSYLGQNWGQAPPRYTVEKIVEMTRGITAKEGVVTWDVPIDASGHIPQAFVDQLIALRKGLK